MLSLEPVLKFVMFLISNAMSHFQASSINADDDSGLQMTSHSRLQLRRLGSSVSGADTDDVEIESITSSVTQ